MAELICPKCGAGMEARTDGSVETDLCPQCGGVWIDVSEEKGALDMKPEVFTVDELRLLRKVYQPSGTVEEVKYRKCPRCQELMWRINYLHHSGIVVDKCRQHGTFFDKDELQKAMEFIRAGGVEYEKLRIAEKGISELRHRLDKVSDKVERISYKLPWQARLLHSLGF